MKRYGWILVFVLILSASPTPFARADWWDCNWLYSIQLTFNNTASSENLVNFPILVNLTSSSIGWANVQSDGDDLRFLDSDNSTVLDYEIEYWDYAGEEALIWVEVPQIDAGSTTDHIFLYYGNAGASSGEDVEGTWNQDYVMVQHLQEQNGTVYDSTANSNDGSASPTTFGQDKWVSGLRGNALNFDGSNDYVDTPFDGTEYDELTITFWAKTNDLSPPDFLYTIDNSPGAYGYIIRENTDGRMWFYARMDVNGLKSSSVSIPDTNWHFYTCIVNTTAVKISIDDGSMAETTFSSDTIKDSPDTVTIGSAVEYDDIWDGLIDDIMTFSRELNSTEISHIHNSGAGADPMNSTGLVGWWKLDESDLTENATDSSGSGNHGTLYGYPPDYTSGGQIDGATDFDGNEDYISIPYDSSFNVSEVTLETWIQLGTMPSDGSPVYRVILEQGQSSFGTTGTTYSLVFSETANQVIFVYGNTTTNTLANANLADPDVNWHYLVGTYNGTWGEIYLDGSFVDIGNKEITNLQIVNEPFQIGEDLGDRPFNGTIEECRVSNVSRTADWIEAQYLSMTDQFITFSGISDMIIELFITVEDAADSQPIEDACVNLFYSSLNFTEFTDSDGEIPRKVVDVGNYTLIVTADTYQTYSYILFINQTTYWVPQLDTLEEGITIPLAFMTFMFAGLGVMYYSIREKTPEQRTLGFIFCIILWIATWGMWIFDNSTSNSVVLGWVFMAPIGLCMIFLTEGAIDYLDKVESEL